MSRRHLVLALPVLVGLPTVVGAAAPRQAPERPGCTDGDAPILCDGTWFGDADATVDGIRASGQGVDLDLSASFSSTFFVDVAQGVTTGEWSLGGDWTMTFSGEVAGTAEVVSSADGTVSGSAGEFGVSATMTNQGSVSFGGAGSQPISNSHPLEGLSVKVDGGTCVEAIGEWSFSWATLAAEVGWAGTDRIVGGFTAVRQPGFEQQTFVDIRDKYTAGELTQADIEASPLSPAGRLLFSSLVAWNGFVATRPPPSDANVNQALDLAERIELAVADLRNESGCEVDLSDDQLSSVTGLPAGYVETIAERIAAGSSDTGPATLRRLFNAGIRTGLIGAGATSSEARQAAFNRALSTRLDQIVAEGYELAGTTVSRRTAATDDQAGDALLAADLAIDAGLPVTVSGTQLELTNEVIASVQSRAQQRRSDAATPPVFNDADAATGSENEGSDG